MSNEQMRVRKKKKSNFTQVSNEILHDTRLSWKAKGIMSYLLSLPDDWVIYFSEVTKHSKDGVTAFRSGIKELKEYGYLERVPVRDDDTKRIIYWETLLVEEPSKEIQQTEKPHSENPHVQNLYSGKCETNNTVITNTLLTNTDNTNTNNNITTFEEDAEAPKKTKEQQLKEDVRKLVDFYNEKKLIKHTKVTDKMISSVKARLEDGLTLHQLSQAISNYAIVYHGEQYYFTKMYPFSDLMREKDVYRFIDEAKPLEGFLKGNGKKPYNSYQQNNQAPRSTYDDYDKFSI